MFPHSHEDTMASQQKQEFQCRVPAFIQHGHTFGGRLGSGAAVESVGITRLPAFGAGAGMGVGGTKPSSGEETKLAPACASSSAPSILHEG